MKIQLCKYFETNNIITPEHHGGRFGHSTVFAKACMDYDNSMESNIVEVSSTTALVLNELKPVLKVMDMEMRKEIVTAKVISIVSYGPALYVGQTDVIKRKIEVILMRC